MNSIMRLRADDMFIDAGTKGPVLCNGIKGLALVMFYSPNCTEICVPLLQEFKRLPQIINGCKFCILNINENQGVLQLSRQTIAPIEVVPYIVFYINGRPFLQYDDDASLSKLVAFTTYVMKLVESKRSFIDKGAKVESEIPKYSVAKPYLDMRCTDDGFCYLTSTEAYKNAKTHPSGNSGMPGQNSDHFRRS